MAFNANLKKDVGQDLQVIEKPWGRERILEQNDRYVVKILEVDAGQTLSLQYHVVKTETMYCLYGDGTLVLTDETNNTFERHMMPGRYQTITPGVVHRLSASPHSVLAILETSTPELDDVVRLIDNYGRA
jgi:mannose-6-phosphate isomerase-like protein (cupin superfamily)